jgi:ACS family glucarate transporter-like MFS transporter
VGTDRFTQIFGLTWGRRLFGVLSQWLAAAGLVVSLMTGNPYIAIGGFAFAAFSNDLGLGAVWAYFQDAGGSYVATFLGFANMCGNLGAFASPLLLGFMAQKYGWSIALGTCAGFFVLSGVFWLGVDARKPIIPQTGK